MKLVKILSDKVQIRSDYKEFDDVRINDLIAVSDGEATLSSYCTTMTMNIWFMAHLDWDAQAVAASMRDEIMLNDCQVPIVDEDGKVTGKALRVTPPTTRKVDEGIVQLSLSFDVYFQPEAQRTKMQKFYLAWQNAKQEIQNRRL